MTPPTKSSARSAFTILESILVLIAIVIISFLLAGLYLKNFKSPPPPDPGKVSAPAGSTGPSGPKEP
jgi:hypothetical protein